MKSKKCKLSALVFYSVIIALAVGLPNMAFANPLPDTGQTKCYNNTVEIPCPQPGIPFYGQDAQYTINPRSYSDLGNGIVRDNVTGLEWQQATAPGTYNWEEANTYCTTLTLGGYNDWRLPEVRELSSLVDSSSVPFPGPIIDTTYFPGTQAAVYWAFTPHASYSYTAWQVFFADGTVTNDVKSYKYYVRAVRGGQSNNFFVDNNDGTITETGTGLMWQQATAPGTYTWEQALTYCENLTLGGYNDWRLPNKNELLSIVDYSRYNPAFDTTFFSGSVASSLYWSSTTDTFYPYYARCLYSGDGSMPLTWKFFDGYEFYYAYVRAVRGGQYEPTVINLSSFTATPKAGKVILTWSTASEIDNAGFNLSRSETENGNYTKINTSLIPAAGSSTQGASYEFVDTNVQNRKTYYYKLEDIDLNGTSTMHGSVKATPRWIYGAGK